jgi:hypothetical protein
LQSDRSAPDIMITVYDVVITEARLLAADPMSSARYTIMIGPHSPVPVASAR